MNGLHRLVERNAVGLIYIFSVYFFLRNTHRQKCCSARTEREASSRSTRSRMYVWMEGGCPVNRRARGTVTRSGCITKWCCTWTASSVWWTIHGFSLTSLEPDGCSLTVRSSSAYQDQTSSRQVMMAAPDMRWWSIDDDNINNNIWPRQQGCGRWWPVWSKLS